MTDLRRRASLHGGRRARPLEQPEGIEIERPGRHPFNQWLTKMKGRKRSI